ncbi:hypothetical protein LJY25_02700 [Hymenobacter sp. BT175]|uniref:hypothetical protein n=1 Tax=Hymenobacter translucens TaxID=2886507 RepID=UPI001D0E3537|nr:hypothetical protein [Hymenobacter translucens]MCC2545340.1 hypothetical protein [Hymenobacter translucens]
MKKLLLLALAGALASCEKEGPATHQVQARVTGTDLSGLGARLNISEVRDINAGRRLKNLVIRSIASRIDTTYELGTFGPADLVAAEASFGFVTPTGSIRPSAQSSLVVELVADGKVVARTTLNASASGYRVAYDPFLKGIAELRTDWL